MAFLVKRIAIIGAGPCGLAAAKYLIAQKAFEKIVIFERHSEVGGVWNYSKKPTPTQRVPQTDPFCPPDAPILAEDGTPIHPSPMYDILHANIPQTLMAFSDAPFPPGLLVFPARDSIEDYLKDYAKEIRDLIAFCREVTQVRLRDLDGRDAWDVQTRSTTTGEVTEETFDAVVVANGHYATPFMPAIPRIREFHEAHRGVITHAKVYRSPHAFAGKKVVVVGNAASGMDIGSQISRVCRSPLLLSVRTATPPETLAWIGADEVPPIEEFLVSERGVRFEGGRIETDIDAVVFCTGYLYSFPFLQDMDPPLVRSGRRVHGLYKHFIHIEHPTLVFPGLPVKVVPFPESEAQAAIFARLWANALPLPSVEQMTAWEEAEAAKKGDAIHVFAKGEDDAYIREMHEWAATATSTTGKEPPLWDEELRWQRRVFAEARLKFQQEGCKAKSLDELGFHFVPEGDGDTADRLL